jgi:hypothetical protein
MRVCWLLLAAAVLALSGWACSADEERPDAGDEPDAASEEPGMGDDGFDAGPGDQGDGGDPGGADDGVGDAGGDVGPGIWHPAPGTSWQWQLSGTIDTSVDVTMYDIDLFDTPRATIDALRAAGRVVICYFSAGSLEDWRPDAGDFPRAAVGLPLDGWDGEWWIDVRSAAIRQIMRARLDLAVDKGCDGVEPDNVDGYANDSGFDLRPADQIDYNRHLAAEAHARGLSIGLKNDLDQVPELVGDFDWALNEECFAYDECDTLLPFLRTGKAVFQVEYGGAQLAQQVCPRANALDFDSLIKKLELDAWRIACR